MGVEAEDAGTERLAGEPAETMGGEVTGDFGEEKTERGLALGAAAQMKMAMPDEGAGEKRGFVFRSGAGHGGQGMSAASDFSARKDR